MAQINVSNLTFGYEGSYDTIFENVSFSIDTSWKLWFCGKKRKGKDNVSSVTPGKIRIPGAITRSVVFDYFPYPVETKRSGTDSSGADGRLESGSRELESSL